MFKSFVDAKLPRRQMWKGKDPYIFHPISVIFIYGAVWCIRAPKTYDFTSFNW